MTNHDFWMSISDIINEGFTSEGLAKLDDYAEQFSTGKILYKRFSPSEQLGCVKGGTIHVIASLLAGAEVGTDQLTAPEGSFKREQQLAKIQEKRIEDWAKAAGFWISNLLLKRKSARRPGGFAIRRKKRFDILKRGICNPPSKVKHTPLLRIANPQSLNRLGHFLTPDCKSAETPSELARKPIAQL